MLNNIYIDSNDDDVLEGSVCVIYNLLSMPARACSPGQCVSGQTCLMASQICLIEELALRFISDTEYGMGN